MLKGIFTAIDKITGVPKKVMLAGLLSALCLLVFGAGMLFGSHISYTRFVLSAQVCKTAMDLFSEGIIFGLFLDILLKRT